MPEAQKPPKVEINRNNLFLRGQRYFELLNQISVKNKMLKAQIEAITTKALEEEENKKGHTSSSPHSQLKA